MPLGHISNKHYMFAIKSLLALTLYWAGMMLVHPNPWAKYLSSSVHHSSNYIAALKSLKTLFDMGGRWVSLLWIRWRKHTPPKIVLLLFLNLKRSSTWLIPSSLYAGHFFYFYVESVFLSSSISKSKHVVLTPGTVDYIISLWLIIILCVDYIHEISMLKVEALLKLTSSFVLTSNTFDKKILPWELTCYVNLYTFMSPKYYSWKVLLR